MSAGWRELPHAQRETLCLDTAPSIQRQSGPLPQLAALVCPLALGRCICMLPAALQRSIRCRIRRSCLCSCTPHVRPCVTGRGRSMPCLACMSAAMRPRGPARTLYAQAPLSQRPLSSLPSHRLRLWNALCGDCRRRILRALRLGKLSAPGAGGWRLAPGGRHTCSCLAPVGMRAASSPAPVLRADCPLPRGISCMQAGILTLPQRPVRRRTRYRPLRSPSRLAFSSAPAPLAR
jgi:hypothetical protein